MIAANFGNQASQDSISIRSYAAGAVASGGADETAKVQAWINAGIAQNKPIVGAPLNYNISSAIDMRGNNMNVTGNGMQLTRTNFTGPVLLLGGNTQRVNNIFVRFSSQATVGQTAANGFEFSNPFEGEYDGLTAELCNKGYYLAQAGYLGSTTNTVFSCSFTNIFANGWTDVAIDLQTWPAGAGSSTGNVWSNMYLHNNYVGGAGVACNGYMRMQDHDEGAFTQVNCEWGIPSGDLIFTQRCRNMNWISMHFEGIQLSSAGGDIALMRAYENCVHTVQGLTLTNSTIVNSANQKAIFRAQQIAGSPMQWDITGIRVRSITNVSTNNLAAFIVEAAGAGNLRAELKNFETTALVGTQIIGDAAGTQVRRYNEAYLGGMTTTRPVITGSKGANAALASLLTAMAAAGWLTDSST